MWTYLVTAEVLDEICLAKRGSAGNIYFSNDYIPGTVWWAALAALTGIRPGEEPKMEFKRVFYSGDIIFSHLYPLEEYNNTRTLPLPLSARVRKSQPGFKNGIELYGEMVNDQRISIYPGGVWDWLNTGHPQVYKSDWQPFTGWYVLTANGGLKSACRFSLRGHTDMAGRSGAATQEALFLRQNIVRQQKFQGYLRIMTQDAYDALLPFIIPDEYDNNPLIVSVGRQPGTIALSFEKRDSDYLPWRNEPSTGVDDVSCLTVTFLSPGILLDSRLRAYSYLPAEEVALALGREVKVEGPIECFSAIHNIGGWNGAYGRPKEIDLAIAAGSAFSYLIQWPSDFTQEERIKRLRYWQNRGLGWRRAEGYGEIYLENPFHTVFSQEPDHGHE